MGGTAGAGGQGLMDTSAISGMKEQYTKMTGGGATTTGTSVAGAFGGGGGGTFRGAGATGSWAEQSPAEKIFYGTNTYESYRTAAEAAGLRAGPKEEWQVARRMKGLSY
jgi:hypothetical protein